MCDKADVPAGPVCCFVCVYARNCVPLGVDWGCDALETSCVCLLLAEHVMCCNQAGIVRACTLPTIVMRIARIHCCAVKTACPLMGCSLALADLSVVAQARPQQQAFPCTLLVCASVGWLFGWPPHHCSACN